MSLRFFWQFLRRPGEIGAISPSSRELADTVTSEVGLEDASVIVELGPGTGVFTREILRRKRPDAALVSIEKNPALAHSLQERFPEVDVREDSAERITEILRERQLRQADCVVCGLPWASFSAELQDRLMAPLLEALRPGGWFTTFAYLQGLLLPGGKRFRRRLGDWFAEVRRSPVVWRNLPPAFAYRCQRG